MAAEAAGRELDVVVTSDLGGHVTDALRDVGLSYEVEEV